MNGLTFRRRDRREFPRKVKLIAFLRCKGKCEGCGNRLVSGDITYDHKIPWAISRDSSLGNCQVICTSLCDRTKTATDIGVIAKSNRVRDKHIGATSRSRHPMPGGKRSPFKFKVGGGIVDRATGQPWRFGR
jgi:5-methylcytosine-specific restriction endonuclease McrA